MSKISLSVNLLAEMLLIAFKSLAIFSLDTTVFLPKLRNEKTPISAGLIYASREDSYVKPWQKTTILQYNYIYKFNDTNICQALAYSYEYFVSLDIHATFMPFFYSQK